MPRKNRSCWYGAGTGMVWGSLRLCRSATCGGYWSWEETERRAAVAGMSVDAGVGTHPGVGVGVGRDVRETGLARLNGLALNDEPGSFQFKLAQKPRYDVLPSEKEARHEGGGLAEDLLIHEEQNPEASVQPPPKFQSLKCPCLLLTRRNDGDQYGGLSVHLIGRKIKD
ncbi:hypothetical protein DFH08DRAFT_1013233 [Mycena albidolilacea]|uniref:Uncharacterized protein n=1 Tax=Mycena albidolilacea TaxID=1033008 RepID=A0AAD6ZU20_9AGAR|nr:hypothetical protein DFH08DRAFT_1013233 [Mycena albidolilacea]